VAELRKALGDDPTAPRFIETVHGRGYRFIAQVTTTTASDSALRMASAARGPVPILVGREAELDQLRGWFAQALEGQRRIVFVTGEPGIGKTTFVRAFLDSIAQERAVRIGCGQCIEQYGAGEPYMPVLEALTRLGQEADNDRVLEVLHRIAPTWLGQMPSLLSEAERAKRPGGAQPVTQQRMLREMAQALETLTADSPLVLLFEDLHWSDFSTLALISAIARRTEPARLLILGTYRPVEMLVGAHPVRTVKEELEVHQLCEELRLQLLGPRMSQTTSEGGFRVDQVNGGWPPLHKVSTSVQKGIRCSWLIWWTISWRRECWTRAWPSGGKSCRCSIQATGRCRAASYR
jgi:hypothetical protein